MKSRKVNNGNGAVNDNKKVKAKNILPDAPLTLEDIYIFLLDLKYGALNFS